MLRDVENEHGHIDKDRSVWLGRWREDEFPDGQLRRIRRRQVLGTLRQLPTEKLALRELSDCLERAAVNRSGYRPLHAATFSQVADRWAKTVLVQFKPSTQINFRCHMEKYLRPFFGALPVKEISAETVQRFVAGLDASPKAARNILATFRVVWNSAKAWSYVDRDPFGSVRLPRSRNLGDSVSRSLKFAEFWQQRRSHTRFSIGLPQKPGCARGNSAGFAWAIWIWTTASHT